MICSAGGYITFQFLPTYLQHEIGIHNALLISSFLFVWHMICVVFGGYLSDKYSYYTIMKVGASITAISSFPSYYLMYKVFIIEQSKNIWPLIVADLLTGLGNGLFGGAMQIFMVYAIDDVVVRYSAIGIAYNLCQAIFGGTAPLIGTALSIMKLYYVGIYVAIFSAISAVILHFLQRKAKATASWQFSMVSKVSA